MACPTAAPDTMEGRGDAPFLWSMEAETLSVAACMLPAHVHYCRADGRIVFMDICRDRYYQLSAAQLPWFDEIESARGPSDLSAPAARFASQLARQGLIIPPGNTGREMRAAEAAPATGSLFDYPYSPCRRALARDLPLFLHATISSWLSLRTRRLETIVGSAARAARGSAKERISPDHLIVDRAERFHALAPFFFTSHDACLFRSLALTRYLRSYGLAAEWIFAVRCAPFRAHSWVQSGGLVLNDHLENVAEYTPILSV